MGGKRKKYMEKGIREKRGQRRKREKMEEERKMREKKGMYKGERERKTKGGQVGLSTTP